MAINQIKVPKAIIDNNGIVATIENQPSGTYIYNGTGIMEIKSGLNNAMSIDSQSPGYFTVSNSTTDLFKIDYSNGDLTINGNTGINGKVTVNDSSVGLEVINAGASSIYTKNSADSVTSRVSAGTSGSQVGSQTNHQLKLLTNNVSRIEVTNSGDVYIPNAYTSVIGGTNTALYIDVNGKIGPFPSAEELKENIVDCPDDEGSFLHSLKIKKLDYVDGPKGVISMIAEDVKNVFPGAVRYIVVDQESGENIDMSGLVDKKSICDLPINEPSIKELNFADVDGNITTKKLTIIKKPYFVDPTSLILPMLEQIQHLKKQIEGLKQ